MTLRSPPARAPRRRSIAPLVALLGALAPGAVRGGPPYVTDDPEPVGLHDWELYLAAQSSFSHGVEGTAPHLEANYGAAPELQLHLLVPLALSAPSGEPAHWGPGDVELGAKYRFVDERRAGVQVGTFPLVTLPTGSASRGLGEGGATLFVPVWLQRSLGPWTTYGGAGYRLRARAGDEWFAGWQAQRRIGSVALGAELLHETRAPDTLRGPTGFSVGAVVDVSELHHLLASVGEDDLGHDVRAYVAWQVTFGPRAEGAPAPAR